MKILIALLAIATVDSEAAAQGMTTLVFVVFTLPLMLVSLPAMVVGDRVGKRSLIVVTKALEVVLMGLGTLALAVAPTGWLPLAVLAGMGAQSALFSPGKYGILPEILPHDQLTVANGRLEAASFLAIILGTVAGGLLLQWVGAEVWLAGGLLTGLSLVGFAAALLVPKVPPSGAPEPFRAVFGGAVGALRQDRVLWLAALGTTVFWGLASLLGQDVLVYGKQVLDFPDDLAGVPYALFAVGVGIGSLLAGRLSRGKVETGLIPLGAVALSLATLAMGLASPGRAGTFALMAVLGVASGFVVVPLNALLQWRAPAGRRGAVIALVNILAFGGILMGNLGCLGLAALGLDAAAILIVAAIGTLAATAWAIWLLPDALLRLVVVLATHSVYRLRLLGQQQIPTAGGALLVANHVSFVDGLLLLAAIDRPIRFVVEQHWYERPLLKPFLRALGAIPIAGSGGPRVVLQALRDAGRALDQGDLVCLFAEGEISRMGALLPFRRGFQRIVKGREVPVVPAHLDRVYGSLGSVRQGRLCWLPAKLPCPVTVSFGAPLPSGAPAPELRRAVEQLGETAFAARAAELEPLHHGLVRAVRRGPLRFCLGDSQGRRLSRLQTLAAALVLARRLDRVAGSQPAIGVLLPPSIGGALTACALSLSGRVAVPLNYTVGPAALAAAVRSAGVAAVVSARAFRERHPLELPAGIAVVYLEDLMADASFGERLAAALRALCWPRGWLERAAGARRRVRRDDVAAILFSSGSTGEPKGVVLTHGNLGANCMAVAQVLPLDRRDRLVGVLPLFHSFGNMALWYAIAEGAGIVFHGNPLDAVGIGELVARHRATILLATPTFLQIYHRRCEPGQFGSLRLVLTGAEKLTEELADAFFDRFGIRPVQGYGATECAPVIATSAFGFRGPGFYQAGARRGSVGRPLPGVAVAIVDPDTRQPLPIGATGLVLVRGANVMQGYLGAGELTAAAMHDGAYVTGDLGRLDEDGFLFLADRLSRFSKIGGEMVPHGAIEEHLQVCSDRSERAFAVCGVPDARKGERLMVLTTLTAGELEPVLQRLGARGLPPLFLPRRDQFVHVAGLPLLGTGKLDLRRVKELCLAAAAPAG